MRSKAIVGGLLAAALLSTAAYTQTAPSAPKAQAQTPMKKHTGDYRASKLIGVNVYNRQNEKIGDINEVLMAKSGRISGVVVGVGGFLGMGEHDVLVKLDQIKFVNEPVASAVATRPRSLSRPAQRQTLRRLTPPRLYRRTRQGQEQRPMLRQTPVRLIGQQWLTVRFGPQPKSGIPTMR